MNRYAFPIGAFGIALLAACAGGGGVATSVPSLSQTQSIAAHPEDAVEATSPFTIYVGFKHKALKTSKYGPIAFYAPTTGKTAPISVASGSTVVFLNDDTTRHTASGLGTSGFPKNFDNTSGTKAVGTTINGSLTWASGSLNPGGKSKTFTVGPKGTYYFGCYYHYHVTPGMRDVIVSM